jgi:hypothetical protein
MALGYKNCLFVKYQTHGATASVHPRYPYAILIGVVVNIRKILLGKDSAKEARKYACWMCDYSTNYPVGFLLHIRVCSHDKMTNLHAK